MKDPMLVAFAKDILGMSDEDIEKTTPGQEQEYKNTLQNMTQYRIVAEVVKSKYCAACFDPGMDVGGLGQVLVDVRIEPVP